MGSEAAGRTNLTRRCGAIDSSPTAEEGELEKPVALPVRDCGLTAALVYSPPSERSASALLQQPITATGRECLAPYCEHGGDRQEVEAAARAHTTL